MGSHTYKESLLLDQYASVCVCCQYNSVFIVSAGRERESMCSNVVWREKVKKGFDCGVYIERENQWEAV